ncbi:MAG: adenylate/guanylate cyclase domain-containing protein [Acidimicrobiales bacterium]
MTGSAKSAPARSSGTVAFLFSDIEGSTRRWQDDPDTMRELLARHDEIWRQSVASAGGRVFKHTGDGVACVFASAGDAATAALVSQSRLRDVLPVRVGVHVGEAQERDGDYFGSTLNRCARLMGLAHGGQVVCSEVTRDLLADSDHVLVDLGVHGLRDLSRPEHVFQIGIGGHPSLRSVDRYTSNLPEQMTSFVGRKSDLDGIGKALDQARLVTIVGAGGVGKTRLAIQAGSELLLSFADGVWLCELAAAADAAALEQVVASAIGATQRPGLSLAASIVDVLRDRWMLLVLDNCEHLLDEAASMAESMLRACRHVAIIATSREALSVDGEQVWPLHPLELPASGDDPIAADAVRLFVDRATAAKPDFVIGGHTDAVVEICRRLDGVPLAIELAAARVTSMTPRDIEVRLHERFRLLTGGRRRAVERHQTLRATVEWSYDLLTETERVVFDCLGVFAGSFDIAAIEGVVTHGDFAAWDAIDTVASLVAKSMVVAEDHDQTKRYRLLETMRHFALEQLAQVDTVQRRHAGYYAERAEQTGRGLRGPDELAWRASFRADQDNLRAAVSWALDSPDSSSRTFGLRIIAALAHESMQEGESIGVAAEAALVHMADAPPGVRVATLAGAAWYVHRRGDIATARELCLEAVRDGPPADSPSPELAYFVLALTAMSDPSAQSEIFRNAHLSLDAIAADDFAHAFLRSAELYMQLIVGNTPPPAIAREALLDARRIGSPSLLVRQLCNLATLSWLDEPETARLELEEAVTLTQLGASAHMLGFGWSVLARLRADRGDLHGA